VDRDSEEVALKLVAVNMNGDQVVPGDVLVEEIELVVE
jgi:hypothetical protein